MPTLPPLDPNDAEPIYRQLYWRFRRSIADGLLKPGERVPAARALAKELGLARGTIDNAYALLTAEGYIEPRGQAGTVVSHGVQTTLPTRVVIAPYHAARQHAPLLPFQMGLPALDAFPRKIWSKIAARCVRATQLADMANPPVQGLPALRTAIASYLQVARGIHCAPEQIFVTSGYRNSLSLITHALLKPGDNVLVEDPGYLPTRPLLNHLHIQTQPVPVDHDGLCVQHLGDARAVIVTPAHQSPLCVSLSLPRRLNLLEWASRQQAWIIEDDYDGEYRYVSRPLPALKSLDREGRVLYAGTFSKVLFPGIRLAYLVVPAAQVAHFEQVSQTFLGNSPELTQAIVASFMAEGHFARHIQRMRKLYGERREATANGLRKVLGEHISIDAQPGGMHLILRLKAAQSDRLLAEKLAAAGIYAEALSGWSVNQQISPGLLLGFANIDSQARAEALGQRILECLMA
ncbi:DNA-binding protein [Pseudomonas fluorescens]|uniref:DNA-binding protein n=1 Tax=Pseudomonas fluorescens TaxID=294 RepID=A0A1T2XXW8_PSEFL|nr:PLP-dependent aminotransferase family protein [Pseudomonas fluorescens]OPA84704.1 DNA-binding protein [Pseudomonas fluorescens]